MKKNHPSGPILWRRLDHPGHESALLFRQADSWRLQGTAVFSHDQRACRLDYQIVCDSRWHTESATVEGWVGDNIVEVRIEASPGKNWRLNEVDCQEVSGCIDLDLNFSPSTNLLPIRRLGLEVGQAAEVRAAWLRFPSFRLEPLAQVYRRLDETRYGYESAGGGFVAELDVNSDGFVKNYAGIWALQ